MAKRLLQLENNLFMPHVNLMHGDHAMETREEAARRVLLPNTVYNVTRLAFVSSTSDPSEWDISSG